MPKKYFLIIFISMISSFFFGVGVIEFQIFPYDSLKDIKSKFQKNSISIPQSEIYQNDVSELLRINTADDIFLKRLSLIQYIWKTSELPTTSTFQINTEISDIRFENLKNLEKIDQFSIVMDNGVISSPYLFHSQTSNGTLIIYHQGHKGDFVHGSELIQTFLVNGYDVIAFSMPLMGSNNQPIIDHPNFGKIRLSSHNHLRLLESDDFSPIKYFLEPITISLNYIDQEYDYLSYSMIGISGGGWTSTLYSAIDDRISKSFSVSGSYPIYLRSDAKNFGDYEQTLPELYTISNYLELYVMSSFGENRLHVQFFTENDPCCFSGTNFESYKEIISQKILTLNEGTFMIYLDKTHNEHKISEYAIEKILEHLS